MSANDKAAATWHPLHDHGDGLRARVEELEADNAALRQRVAELEARCSCGELGRHARLHDRTCPVYVAWDRAHPPSRGDL